MAQEDTVLEIALFPLFLQRLHLLHGFCMTEKVIMPITREAWLVLDEERAPLQLRVSVPRLAVERTSFTWPAPISDVFLHVPGVRCKGRRARSNARFNSQNDQQQPSQHGRA